MSREVTISNPPKRNPDKAERKRIKKAEHFTRRLSFGFSLLSAHR